MKSIKKANLLMAIMLVTGLTTKTLAQNAGLSFSFFFPRNGYFSTPISPFSVGGIGVELNRNFSLETGFSLYRMSGVSITNLPFSTNDPLLGPNFTLLVPAELVFKFGSKEYEIQLKAGVFGFMGFDNKINYGNLDKAIRTYEGWDIANSEISIQNAPGWGGKFGAEYIYYVSRDFGITIEFNYYLGGAITPINGRYWGGKLDSPPTSKENVQWNNATIDFTGIEISLGILFGS